MHNGFAIAIAWPETKCKEPNSWYDPIMKYLGFNQNGFYKVGHAAILLINSNDGLCNYFDFGRYHAPFMQGRVRDVVSDHDLKIRTKAIIKDNKIINFEAILSEVSQNQACHGDGYIRASYCGINYDKAFFQAKNMQNNSPIDFGPFVLWGTNCSRFVRTILLAGEPKIHHQLKLVLPYSISPTPVGNINSLGNLTRLEKVSKQLNYG